MKNLAVIAVVSSSMLVACGSENGSSGPGRGGNQITKIESAIERVQDITDCEWSTLFIPHETRERTLFARFCSLDETLPEELTIEQVRARSFSDSLVAVYEYNGEYEGFPYLETEPSVFNGLNIRLTTLTESMRSQLLNAINLDPERLTALENRDPDEIRIEGFSLIVDFEYFLTRESGGREVYLRMRPTAEPSYDGRRLSEYGREVRDSEERAAREAEEEQRARKAAAKARAAQQESLTSGYEGGRFLFFTDQFGTSQPLDSYQFAVFGSALRSARDRFFRTAVSERIFSDYYNFLVEIDRGLVPEARLEERAEQMLGENSGQSIDRAGIIIGRHSDLYQQVRDYHQATIFEKQAQRDDLLQSLIAAMQSDILSLEDEYLMLMSASVTMGYDFDRQAFVALEDEVDVGMSLVLNTLGNQFEQRPNVSEWLVKGFLNTLEHNLVDLTIAVPPSDAQRFVARLGRPTRADDQFTFHTLVALKSLAATRGRNSDAASTGVEDRFSDFQGTDFTHHAWQASCVLIAQGKNSFENLLGEWEVGRYQIQGLHPHNDTGPCAYVGEFLDAFAVESQ